MMTKTKFTLYLVFLLFQAIWMGSGFHSTLSDNLAWYSDPVIYVHHLNTYPVPGVMNPWPISTGLLALATIACIILFIRYKDSGKSYVSISLYGTFLILLATFLYFVPTLMKIFGNTALYSDEEIIAMSRQWVILNCIRILMLIGLFITALLGLSHFPKGQLKD